MPSLILLLILLVVSCKGTYLLRANSSLVVTQVADNGRANATVFITDNRKNTVVEYMGSAVTEICTDPSQIPSLGTLNSYVQLSYCGLCNNSTRVQLLYVNDTRKEVVIKIFDAPTTLSICKQTIMVDVDGDGFQEFAILQATNEICVEVVILLSNGNGPHLSLMERFRTLINGALSSYSFKLAAGRIKRGENAREYIAISAFTGDGVKLWILGMNGDDFSTIGQLFITEDLNNLYTYCIPMGITVAYLNDDDGKGTSTVVIAYQDNIIGSELTIKLRSYQITAGGSLTESAPATMSIVTFPAPPVNISLTSGRILSSSSLVRDLNKI